MAVFPASSGEEVAGAAGAGEMTVGIADETETLETDARTPYLSETTVVGNVIETGGIATGTASGEEDVHHQGRGGRHLAGTSETVICR